MVALVTDTQGFTGSCDYTRAIFTAINVFTGRVWHSATSFIPHACRTVRKIARPANAYGGIVMSNGADAPAYTCDPFTGVFFRGFLANIFFQCKTWVADADWPNGTNSATSMVTTVDISTYICGGDAIVLNSAVALVTDTQGLI